MTLPIDLFPLRQAMEEMLLSGSGISPYVVPTGSFSLDTYYENRLAEQLSFDSLTKPNINITFTNIQTIPAWFQPNAATMYSIEAKLDLAYHLDSRFLRTKRSYVETDVYNKSIVIGKAFRFPNNLLTTISGSATGLISGRFDDYKISSIRNDYENSVALASIIFSGKVVLSNG